MYEKIDLNMQNSTWHYQPKKNLSHAEMHYIIMNFICRLWQEPPRVVENLIFTLKFNLDIFQKIIFYYSLEKSQVKKYSEEKTF